MTRQLITLITLCALSLSAAAQVKTFTVAAMNVDGMPKNVKIAGIYTVDLNPDAKEAAGATAIGQKLVGKGYDLIGVSEDFNYDSQIMEQIGSVYASGTHRGKISASISAITNYIAKNPLFDTDGLNFYWRRNAVEAKYESWTAWWDHNGYSDSGADGLIKKGFRYYMADFGDDVLVDVYILHMDAEVSGGDIAARESQLRQLADDILRINPSLRPKIVMGDTNCRYTRDQLKTLFIDVINADPRYTIKDCWVERCKQNTYPAYGSNALMVNTLGYVQGEIVDKIFYINPKYGKQLSLNSFIVDTDFNDESGEPLADHYPVVAKFTATKNPLYDPASYWSDAYDATYQAYAALYNRLMPLTATTSLPEPFRSQLPLLLTEHVATGSDIVARMEDFQSELNRYMQENYRIDDNTYRLKNPSFEEGVRLQTGDVSGWTVATDATEAFISSVTEDGEGAAIRNFTPHDGNYVFNTWGGTPANGFYCHQTLALPAGWYLFTGVVATDANNAVTLRFGDYRESTGPQTDRSRGHYLSIIGYHTGGSIIVGAESNGWFEADDFHLSRLTKIPDAIESVEVDNAQPSARPNGTLHTWRTFYSPDGRTLTAPRRGINIIRKADGGAQKVFVR